MKDVALPPPPEAELDLPANQPVESRLHNPRLRSAATALAATVILPLTMASDCENTTGGGTSHSSTRKEGKSKGKGCELGEAPAYEHARLPVTPVSEAKALARQLGRQCFGSRWIGQWDDLETLWKKESSWRTNARNRNGGACGIPQALPCSKMGAFRYSAEGQIWWGLWYIKQRYGSPGRALSWHKRHNWY